MHKPRRSCLNRGAALSVQRLIDRERAITGRKYVVRQRWDEGNRGVPCRQMLFSQNSRVFTALGGQCKVMTGKEQCGKAATRWKRTVLAIFTEERSFHRPMQGASSTSVTWFSWTIIGSVSIANARMFHQARQSPWIYWTIISSVSLLRMQGCCIKHVSHPESIERRTIITSGF